MCEVFFFLISLSFLILFFLVSSTCVSNDGRQDAAFDFAAVFLPFFGFLSFVSFCDSMTANAIFMLSPASADARVSFFLVVAGVRNSTLSVILLLLCWAIGTLTVLVEYPCVDETPLEGRTSCTLASSFGISLCGVLGGSSDGGEGAGLSGFGGGTGVCFGCVGIGFGLIGVCCSSADSDT